MHTHKDVYIHYTPCTVHTCMFTKYLRQATHHIRQRKEGGRGVRGGRSSRGEKRNQRKGDEKIISDLLHDSELSFLHDFRNNKNIASQNRISRLHHRKISIQGKSQFNS